MAVSYPDTPGVSQYFNMYHTSLNWAKIIVHVQKFMECLVEAYRMNLAPSEEKI